MKSIPLDPSFISPPSNIFHATSVNSAISILKDKLIHGTDKGQHANFKVNKDFLVAKHCEVVIEFHWVGRHETMSTPGLDFTPLTWENGPCKNVLYHCFSDEPATDNYLQSNLFPGSTGLVFKKAHPMFSLSSKQSVLARIFSRKKRMEHRAYLYQKTILDFWRKSEGLSISVTDWNEGMPRKMPYF